MTALTISRPAATPNFAHLLRIVGAKLRRAFELSGNAYADGAMPPL